MKWEDLKNTHKKHHSLAERKNSIYIHAIPITTNNFPYNADKVVANIWYLYEMWSNKKYNIINSNCLNHVIHGYVNENNYGANISNLLLYIYVWVWCIQRIENWITYALISGARV